MTIYVLCDEFTVLAWSHDIDALKAEGERVCRKLRKTHRHRWVQRGRPIQLEQVDDMRNCQLSIWPTDELVATT